MEGGILVKITSPGFAGDDSPNSSCEKFTGLITDGKGKGKHFVKLQGYARQFRQKLGYDPYPGTLNVDLTSGSIQDLDLIPAICINAWSTDEKTFGAVYCYPAIIKGESGTTHKPAHIIVPERTSHDNTTLEIIAPTELRLIPEIETNKQVTVHV
ncbi:CTP-dependent riboflavin kinase [Halobacterium sp. KA-4]|nr:CTP-dependent riboflavin kinase [Halobacterium sp. KA-4]